MDAEGVPNHVGLRVRVRPAADRGCEDWPHRSGDAGRTGTIIRCHDRPDGPSHPWLVELDRAVARPVAGPSRPVAPQVGYFAPDELEPLGRTAAPESLGGDPGPRPFRELRVERVLSIRELARLAGVAPSTVYLIETSRTTPHPASMRRLAAALGVDPHEVTEFRRAIDAGVPAGPGRLDRQAAARPVHWSAPCAGDDMGADDLMDWVAELRGRAARGELADMGAVDIDGVTLPVERVARILLADLADQELARERRRTPSAERRREALLRDFRRLRARIG